jgi:copper homeostasis protein
MPNGDTQLSAPSILVEACATTLDEAKRAAEVGAGRIELCVDLDVGGLTPPAALVREVKSAIRIPVFVMIRPRAGDFVVSPAELDRMDHDASLLLDAGADGIVLGTLLPDGSIDERALERLVLRAGANPVTFHRAFDEIPDGTAALEILAAIGVTRILTSGQAPTALDGARLLSRWVRQSAGRISIMPGGGVRAKHAQDLVNRTGVSEVHARASAVANLVQSLR